MGIGTFHRWRLAKLWFWSEIPESFQGSVVVFWWVQNVTLPVYLEKIKPSRNWRAPFFSWTNWQVQGFVVGNPAPFERCQFLMRKACYCSFNWLVFYNFLRPLGPPVRKNLQRDIVRASRTISAYRPEPFLTFVGWFNYAHMIQKRKSISGRRFCAYKYCEKTSSHGWPNPHCPQF